MADTYTQIYLQFVFAVRNRESLIGRSVAPRLYSYIGGLIQARKQKLIAVGGMPDHIHLLCGIRPPFSISDFMRDIKSNSSAFVHDQRLTRGRFHWQSGYGGFSYGRSQLDTVARYVCNQEEHHKRRSFRSEYLELLRRFEVAYDSRYVFDWIDHDPTAPPDLWLPPLELAGDISDSVSAGVLRRA